jgi:hypothetical protein
VARLAKCDRVSSQHAGEKLATAKAMSLPYHREKSRAILIPAGGRCKIYDASAPQFYFWGAFAAAWTLRHHGCILPIEFWFLPGEMEEIPHVELFAKQVAATCHVVDTSNMRCVHGWQIKINAILQTKHTQVLHLDADNIVTKTRRTCSIVRNSKTMPRCSGLITRTSTIFTDALSNTSGSRGWPRSYRSHQRY